MPRPARILVIDDELSVRKSITDLLDLLDYSVIEAAGGEEGIRLALQVLPDLVICDVAMPGTGGFTVLSEIKKNPAASAIPFLFLSAHAAEKDIREGISLGANAYLVKPFTISELQTRIEALLIPPGDRLFH